MIQGPADNENEPKDVVWLLRDTDAVPFETHRT